jgi:hypothetical protein
MNQKWSNFYENNTVQQNQPFLYFRKKNRKLVKMDVLNVNLGFKRQKHPPLSKDMIKI